MDRNDAIKVALRRALEASLRYKEPGSCSVCAEVHTTIVHLDSITGTAEEVYRWLGFGVEKQDLRLFGRVAKILGDVSVTGDRARDIPRLVDELFVVIEDLHV
jgi:hypothetical protein